MKRSEIDLLIKAAKQFYCDHGWALPPNARWNVTDFGLADWRRFGLVLVNLAEEPEFDDCILNEFELERTTAIPTRSGDGSIDLEGVELACQRLLEAGVREWVVVHFPEGACALRKDGVFHVQGSLCIPQSKIVSSVGAGDAFAAGVLYGLHENVPIETALKYGVVSAASCLFGVGTSDSIPPLDECRKLENAFGFRKLH
jgi:sugar/nucleoside kinase (ribokinase family)